MMALLLGAAIPLALGWMKVLPAERDPFSRPDQPPRSSPRDRFAVFLLVNVSLSLLAAIPRIADSLHLDRLIQFLPASWSEHVGVIFLIWLVFVPPSLPPTPPSAQIRFGRISLSAVSSSSPSGFSRQLSSALFHPKAAQAD